MLKQIYVIHDITAEVYTDPFYGINDQVAIRTCQNLVHNPGTTFYENPEDFRLYNIGLYNEEKAEIQTYEPRLIVRLSDLLIKKYSQEEGEENGN